MSHSKPGCSDGSCSSQKSHGSDGCGCGCGCSSCQCGSSKGKCQCEGKCHCYSDKLLCLADQAWEELLKEKIKAEILTTSGAQLTELAKLINETNHKRWKNIMSEKGNEESFKERLKNIFEKQ